jgi:hypothetical protein
METPERVRPERGSKQLDIGSKHLDRLSNFNRMDGFLKELSKDEICSLGKIFNNPTSFGESAEAQAFRIKIDDSFGMAAKIMKNNKRSLREIEWYYYLMSKFPNFPNFPLVSRYEICDVCKISKTYNQKDWRSEVVANNCIVLFSELADGDLQGIVEVLKTDEDSIASMVSQVLMALLVLEQEGIVHNDLHFGNLLYHDQDVDLTYLDDQITIPSKGRVWTLWDFGMMVKNGEDDPGNRGYMPINTFETDWKMTFLPKLVEKFGRSPFVQRVNEITKISASIWDVINKI